MRGEIRHRASLTCQPGSSGLVAAELDIGHSSGGAKQPPPPRRGPARRLVGRENRRPGRRSRWRSGRRQTAAAHDGTEAARRGLSPPAGRAGRACRAVGPRRRRAPAGPVEEGRARDGPRRSPPIGLRPWVAAAVDLDHRGGVYEKPSSPWRRLQAGRCCSGALHRVPFWRGRRCARRERDSGDRSPRAMIGSFSSRPVSAAKSVSVWRRARSIGLKPAAASPSRRRRRWPPPASPTPSPPTRL